MCPNNQYPITQVDFACIGDVATHCDNKKLCIAIDESAIFDMSQLFCDNWNALLAIISEVYQYQEAYALYMEELAACEANPNCTTPPIQPMEPDDYTAKLNLVCGGAFTGCNGKELHHLGLVRAWVYYAYARYVLINPYSDTANGLVQKTNEFSLPVPMKEYQQVADRYRTMGFETYKLVAQAVKNSGLVDNAQCGCGYCGQTKAKGYGIQSSIIRKKIR